jgi:hypothetical protein
VFLLAGEAVFGSGDERGARIQGPGFRMRKLSTYG